MEVWIKTGAAKEALRFRWYLYLWNRNTAFWNSVYSFNEIRQYGKNDRRYCHANPAKLVNRFKRLRILFFQGISLEWTQNWTTDFYIPANAQESGASMVALKLWEQKVGDSNPLSYTNNFMHLGIIIVCFFVDFGLYGPYMFPTISVPIADGWNLSPLGEEKDGDMAKGHEPIKIDQNPLIFSRIQPINEPTVFQTVVVQFFDS